MKYIRIILFVILKSCSDNYDEEKNYVEYIRSNLWGNSGG